MRINEIITENVSPEATMKIIIDVLTTQLPDLYRALTRLADNYAENHGGIDKGFNFIAGGPRSKWFHNVFFNELKPALYNLTKTLPPQLRSQLSEFLNSLVEVGSFRRLEDELIPILINIARVTQNQRLMNAVKSAYRLIQEYYGHLNDLNSGEDDDEEPEIKTPPSQGLTGQQNISAEGIINDVLSKIDKKQAAVIRKAIARSDNKLAALQKELNARGITP